MSSETTVFLVDADPTMHRSIGNLVASVGLRCTAFGSGKEFLERADPRTPGCLLTDVRMPGMSGLDLIDEMKARRFHLPVIVVTGHADVPMTVRAFKSGAADFIEKPFNDQMLLDRVQLAIEHDASRRAMLAARSAVRERIETLTAREAEVMELVVGGKANKECAAELGLSEKTIEVHRSRVMRKLQATNAADLIRMVLEARYED